MAKIVISTERARRSPKRASTAVGHDRVTAPDGSVRVVKKINTASRSFADDVLYAFKSNVKKARSEKTK